MLFHDEKYKICKDSTQKPQLKENAISIRQMPRIKHNAFEGEKIEKGTRKKQPQNDNKEQTIHRNVI